MKRVFILEEPRKHLDVSSAERFGELTYLFQPDERRPSVFHLQHFVEAVIAALDRNNFNPDVDAVVIVGSMLNITVAMMAIGRYVGDRSLKVLMFNARGTPGREYEEHEVQLSKLAAV